MRVVRILSLGVPLAAGAFLMGVGIGRPWTGSYDANGALYSTAARNYLRHGIIATRGGQVCNAGQIEPGDFRFYAHHPPGISLAIAGSFALFGVSEWSARLPFAAFTLGAAALVFYLAWALGGRLAAFFAAFLFAVQPMVAFYGRMPDHEAPAAFFALAQAACWVRWRAEGGRRWLRLGCVVAFAGVWFAWVAVLMPLLLLGVQWPMERGRVRAMLLPAAAGAAGFAAVLCHAAMLEGGLGELWRALATRAGSHVAEGSGAGSFGLAEFLGRHWTYLTTAFSGVVWAVALIWAAGLRVRRRAEALLVAALAAFALFNVVAFRQGSFVHIYYQFYLAMPLCLAAGLALAELCRGRRRLWLALAFWVAGVAATECWVKLSAIRKAEFYLDQMSVVAALREQSGPRDRVLTIYEGARSLRQLAYYADRNFTQVRTLEQAEAVRRRGYYTKAFRLVQVSEREMRLEPAFPGHGP
ncbi:MAG: hypothetical protein FJ291_30390 [Planctomycetes bacterium]|nr:hypothetical protein [Planctomycetota bacterium]